MTEAEHKQAERVRTFVLYVCPECGQIDTGPPSHDDPLEGRCDGCYSLEDGTETYGHPEVQRECIEVVALAPVVEALEEAEQRFTVAQHSSDIGNEVTAFDYLTTGLNGLRSLLESLSRTSE